MKLMFKEDFTPKAAEKVVFMIAPFVFAIPAITAFAVIPIAGEVRVPFTDITTPLQVTDLPVSVLFIVAIASIGVYGIVLAGWSSGSTYALLGSLRSSAQVISYEVAMGLALVGVFLYAGSLSTSEIVAKQAVPRVAVFGHQYPLWFCLQLLPSFVIYLISMVGETNRAPFDLPEAEGELVGGFHTEYSSMRFAMFFMAEYMNMITVSALATTLFLGGWHAIFPFNLIPGADAGYLGHHLVPGQDAGPAVRLRLAARHAAPAALRPVHAVRVEVADPDLAGLDRAHRGAPGEPRAVCSAVSAWSSSSCWWPRSSPRARRTDPPTAPEEFDAFAGGFPVPPQGDEVLPELAQAGAVRPGRPGRRGRRPARVPARPRRLVPREGVPDGHLRPGRRLRRDLQDHVPQDLHRGLPERARR